MIKEDQFPDLPFATTNPCVISSMSLEDGGEARKDPETEVKEGEKRRKRMFVLRQTGELSKLCQFFLIINLL